MKEACWKLAEWGFKGLMAVCVASLVVPAVVLGLLLFLSLFVPDKSGGSSATTQVGREIRKFENNYNPGTEAYVYTEIASRAFPELDILLSDPRFQSQMTTRSVTAHPLEAMRLLGRVGQNAIGAANLERVSKQNIGQAAGTLSWNKDLLDLDVCLIHLSSEKLDEKALGIAGTVLHEAIHCSRASMSYKHYDVYSRQMFGLLEKITKVGPSLKAQRDLVYVIEEAFVTAAERSLSFVDGGVGKLADHLYRSELKWARRGWAGNESPNVAELMEKLCMKPGDCPTDTKLLSEFLFKNDSFIAALELDAVRWRGIKEGASQ